MLHLNAQLRSKVHGLSAEVERLMHQLADATNESTHFQVMCKREGEEIERLTRQVELLTDERERDEARAEAERLREECRLRKAERDQVERNGFAATKGLVDESERLRAKALAYDLAYRRGAEAMRDECIGAACGFYMGTTGFCNGDEDDLEAVLEALPIPEEPTNG
jgi:chromosome segregation ATPase